jgi:DNA-binding beta-propeller fold protein YncE
VSEGLLKGHANNLSNIEAASAASPKNPYVGPRPIHRGEAFYGRDPELRRLTNLLAAERIVLLHAPSGAGKSSLLNAGLLPRLEVEKNMQVLPVLRVNRLPEKPGDLPQGTNRYLLSALLSLEEAFGEAALPEAELAKTNLVEYLERRWPADPTKRGQMLLLDQFEEVFSLDPYDREAKLEFFTDLGVALQNRDIKALFVMRDDYIGALEPYAVRLPTQLQAAFGLDFLDQPAALEAIIKPAEQAGIHFDEQAARGLVHDLSLVQFQRLDGTTGQQEGPYVEPVQLQVVCKRLWGRLESTGRLLDGIDPVDVAQLGDVSDALAGYYRETVSAVARQLKVPEGQIRRWIGKELIGEQGVRGQVMLVAGQTRGLDNQVISALEDAHLLRREERRRVIWYELAHDRLVPPVQRDNLRFFEAEQGLRLKQAFGGLGGIALVILLILGFLTIRTNLSAEAVAKTATLASRGAELDAWLATRAAGTAQTNAQLATLDATAAKANATQAAMALLPLSELQALSRSGDLTTRINAARALASAGATNLKLAGDATGILVSLIQVANENDASVRLAAAEGLLQISEPSPAALSPYVREIIGASEDTHPEVRRLVAQLLGRVGPHLGEAQLKDVKLCLERLSDDPVGPISLAARESLSALAGLDIVSYVGTWINIDVDTRGWTRIEIRQRGDELGYHIYGKCHPTDCDAGEAWAPYSPGTQYFNLDSGFATRAFTVTLDLEAQILNIGSFTHFTDNSGRSDYQASYQFARGELAQATPTTTLVPVPPVTGPRLFVALFYESQGLAMIDLKTNKLLHTTQFPTINAHYLSLNPKRQEVYVSFANGNTLYIVDAASGEIKGTITEEVGWNSSASVVSPDGRMLYLATSGGPEKERSHKILVIDPAAQRLLKVFNLETAPDMEALSGLAITPDGRILYTVSKPGLLYTIDLETNDVSTHDIIGIRLVGMSEDGRYLYLVSGYNSLLKMAASTGGIIWEVEGVGFTERIAIREGAVFVQAVRDAILMINDESGKVVRELRGNRGSSLVLSQNKGFLYTASGSYLFIYQIGIDKLPLAIPILSGKGPTDLVYWEGP